MSFNLATILHETALATPDAPAYVAGGRTTTYRDLDEQSGRFAEAAKLFAIRAGRGDDNEEKWYARWQHARCLRELCDEEGFVRTALQAFRERPHRAEPLQDLELVLAQVARLEPRHHHDEMQFIQTALDEHDIVPRVRSAAADLSLQDF